MHRFIVSMTTIAVLCLIPTVHLAHADAANSEVPRIETPSIAGVDFDYVDTFGEAKDQTGEHQKR